MTTTSETGEATGSAAAGRGRKKLALIGAIGLALVLVAGGGAFFLLGGGGDASPEAAPVQAAPDPYFHALDTLTVNLNTDGAAPEFLQLEISLELADERQLEVIRTRMPRVIDAFQVYLRELRRSDLEGSAGVYRLKEELLRRVNIAVHPAVVDDILFQNLLVQ